uniref:non-specific serine/threonine protein kinase n=1 Tax=Mesocestoides corti TaxID=53468 RepID=A0A5K3FU17_MESCO
MKKMPKQHLRLRNQVEQVFAERDILSFADNPFVVSLYCTFETKKCLCLVMEFVEGGDVATLLKNIGGPLPDDLAQMYFAELVLALEYLHSYGIVHRDLKPDNLLITHEGHIKLTDFGLSRIGLMNMATSFYERSLDLEKDCKMFRDKQVFGTPEYIAPEVILRQGYGKPVDWWASGIILYEFLVGVVPFYGDTIEALFTQIVSAPIEWPSEEDEGRVSPEAMSIITQLLERDPLLRLGSETGATEVKAAPFFENLDWRNLLCQKAAFVPQLEHDEDCSYFDPRTDRYQHEVENDEDLDRDLLYPPATPFSSSFSSARSVASDCSRSTSKERSSEPAQVAPCDEVNATLTAAEGRLTAERLHSAISLAESPFEMSGGSKDNEVLQDESLFHAFASCTPRFSAAIERATMELPQLQHELVDKDTLMHKDSTPTQEDFGVEDGKSWPVILSEESEKPVNSTNQPTQRLASEPPPSVPACAHLCDHSGDIELGASFTHKRSSASHPSASSIKKMLLVEPTEAEASSLGNANQISPHRTTPTPPASDSDACSENAPTQSPSLIASNSNQTKNHSVRRSNKPSKLPILSRQKTASPHRSLQPGTIVSQTTTKTTSASSVDSRRGTGGTDNSAATRTVVISRGPRGYGFTLRAKDVFYGSSDVYTLHHVIVGVDRKGPAFAAGLCENDLILRVNGREVVGCFHTEVVQLICSSPNPLRLLVTPFAKSNIRSDGHWRARGRLVSRSGRRVKGTHHLQYFCGKASKPSSGDESNFEAAGGGRRILKRICGSTSIQLRLPTGNSADHVAQNSPSVIERRHRHRQLPNSTTLAANRKSIGIADESPKQHSHSFSVLNSTKLAGSNAASSRPHLHPRRSTQSQLFRQLSERNRFERQSRTLESSSGQLSGGCGGIPSSPLAVGHEDKESSRVVSPIALPFDEPDSSAKPTLCVTPPTMTMTAALTSLNTQKSVVETTNTGTPVPASLIQGEHADNSDGPVRFRRRLGSRNAGSPTDQSPWTPGAASSSKGPTDM